MLRFTGDYAAAAACLQQALEFHSDLGYRNGQVDDLLQLGAVQRLTGDYPAAVATLRQALALGPDVGDRYLQAQVLTELAAVQRLTGDYLAATASSQQALSLFRDLPGSSPDAAYAFNELGLAQQLTGDYPAAAASHQQALALCQTRNRHGQAETLNCLGELASRTADGQRSGVVVAGLAIYQRIAAPAARGVQESLLQLRQDNLAPAPER